MLTASLLCAEPPERKASLLRATPERERERERERPVADELNLPQEMRNVQLFEAAEGGDYETVCSLLQLKANPQEHADGVGLTALLAAAIKGTTK